jgi:hypothetical protein
MAALRHLQPHRRRAPERRVRRVLLLVREVPGAGSATVKKLGEDRPTQCPASGAGVNFSRYDAGAKALFYGCSFCDAEWPEAELPNGVLPAHLIVWESA